MVSSNTRDGIGALVDTIDSHAAFLQQEERLAQARHAQAQAWLEEAVRERFGREGIRRTPDLSLAADASPFGRLAELSRYLRID
jgi:LAO/AO transport system kinase